MGDVGATGAWVGFTEGETTVAGVGCGVGDVTGDSGPVDGIATGLPIGGSSVSAKHCSQPPPLSRQVAPVQSQDCQYFQSQGCQY